MSSITTGPLSLSPRASQTCSPRTSITGKATGFHTTARFNLRQRAKPRMCSLQTGRSRREWMMGVNSLTAQSGERADDDQAKTIKSQYDFCKKGFPLTHCLSVSSSQFTLEPFLLQVLHFILCLLSRHSSLHHLPPIRSMNSTLLLDAQLPEPIIQRLSYEQKNLMFRSV